MGGLNKQGEERIECRIRHMIDPILALNVHDQPVSERKNLWNVEIFSFFHQSVPALQNHCHLNVWLDNAEGNVTLLGAGSVVGDDRQVSQSGKPLCTGASLWAAP
ncbi:MAG: hypothetical protein ACLSEY_14585 [Enterocloster sp.]